MNSYQQPTNMRNLSNSPVNLKSNYTNKQSKRLQGDITKTEKETQTINQNTLNGNTRNEFDDVFMQNNKFLKNINAPLIFHDKKIIEDRSEKYEENISNRPNLSSMVERNDIFFNSKQPSLPRMGFEEKLYTFDERKEYPYIEVGQESVDSSECLEPHEGGNISFCSLDSPNYDSVIDHKRDYTYLRNKVTPISENGVDELLKLFPINYCDKMVRILIQLNFMFSSK